MALGSETQELAQIIIARSWQPDGQTEVYMEVERYFRVDLSSNEELSMSPLNQLKTA